MMTEVQSELWLVSNNNGGTYEGFHSSIDQAVDCAKKGINLMHGYTVIKICQSCDKKLTMRESIFCKLCSEIGPEKN